MSRIGDSANAYHPPTTPQGAPTSGLPRNFTKVSGSAIYWLLQVVVLFVSVSFSILCNPIVWFVLKTIFNVLTEVFIYMVLGACSFLISVITHLDDYYTKGRDQMRKYQACNQGRIAATRSGVQIQNCTVKRFLERPNDY